MNIFHNKPSLVLGNVSKILDFVKEFPSENYKNFSKSDKKTFSERMKEFLSFKNRLWKSFDFFGKIYTPAYFCLKFTPLSHPRKDYPFLYTPFINFCEDKKTKQKKRTLSVGTHFNLAYNYASIDQ